MEIYDFGIGWPVEEEKDELFIKILNRECKARQLSFIFIDEKKIDTLTNSIKRGELKIRFYLDMASETHDPRNKFTRFNYCLKDSGARVVADPDDVKAAADKSITHFDLVKSKVPVPYTVIIRNWEPARRLTDEEKEGLGIPFVIKPALGYGQKGVKIIRQKSTLKEIAEARRFDKGDNFLLQEFIEPLELGGSHAWFRTFHLFGEIIPCWWNPNTHGYQEVSLREICDYKLTPLFRIVAEIARITRIDWFSCEIAINKKNKKFVAIDYMNDQCAISPQSKYKGGVPDDVVTLVAERMVDKAWHYIRGRYTLGHRAIWLPKIKVKDEDA